MIWKLFFWNEELFWKEITINNLHFIPILRKNVRIDFRKTCTETSKPLTQGKSFEKGRELLNIHDNKIAY